MVREIVGGVVIVVSVLAVLGVIQIDQYIAFMGQRIAGAALGYVFWIIAGSFIAVFLRCFNASS